MLTVYNFEAKSIQNYILDSSKLKDMIGASEQIEYLCCDDGLLDKVLSSIKLNANPQFVRKAGGAFTIIFSKPNDAKRFQAIWTFCVQQAFPGLNFVQGIGKNEDWRKAIEFADDDFKKDDHNHLLLTFPLAGALVARSPRTGQPAVSQGKKLGERLDAITKHKREFCKGKRLIGKLKFDTPVDWPTNLKNKDKEEDEKTFPLSEDNNYIGIIHADGNNLGQLLKAFKKQLRENTQLTECDYAERLMAFSKAIETANIKSARKAIKNEKIVKAASNNFRTMPARPLVLGGDDFTFIVRGDLSLNFTKHFLEEFEKHTKTEFESLTEKYSDLKKCLPEKLTACAGIAYIKASQPFYQGYKLAESLCQYAKSFSKDERLSKDKLMPSSLAFRRITTSIINSYEAILEDELIIGNSIQITMQPYLVGEVKPTKTSNCVYLENLQDLYQLLKDNELSQGIFRELLSLLEINRSLAEQAMRRWYDNMEKRQQQDLLIQLKEILKKMGLGEQPTDSLKFIGSEIEKFERTPIGDVLALIKVG